MGDKHTAHPTQRANVLSTSGQKVHKYTSEKSNLINHKITPCNRFAQLAKTCYLFEQIFYK